MKLLISVIICTYNRCESLKHTLQSLLDQKCDHSFDYEVIVIDNNSKDNTRGITESYITISNKKLKYLFESKQGKSYALNTGIGEATGNIIAFTDDDVIVSNEWIKNIHYNFKKYNADCVFGKIMPIWEKNKPPKWLIRDKRLLGNLALLDYGEEVKIVDSSTQQFFGANFAVSSSVLKTLGEFNINYGVQGNKHYLGEDTDIFLKLLAFNKRIIYAPSAFVWHKINVQRTTKRYFIQWHYFGGCSFANKFSNTTRASLRIPFWFIKEHFLINLKFLYYVLTLNSRESFIFYLKSVHHCGALVTFFKKDKYAKS